MNDDSVCKAVPGFAWVCLTVLCNTLAGAGSVDLPIGEGVGTGQDDMIDDLPLGEGVGTVQDDMIDD